MACWIDARPSVGGIRGPRVSSRHVECGYCACCGIIGMSACSFLLFGVLACCTQRQALRMPVRIRCQLGAALVRVISLGRGTRVTQRRATPLWQRRDFMQGQPLAWCTHSLSAASYQGHPVQGPLSSMHPSTVQKLVILCDNTLISKKSRSDTHRSCGTCHYLRSTPRTFQGVAGITSKWFAQPPDAPAPLRGLPKWAVRIFHRA